MKNLKLPSIVLPLSVIGLAILLLVVSIIFFFVQFQKSKKTLELPDLSENVKIEEQNTQLIETIGKLVELPANETPTIATVADHTKLSNQVFFEKAQDGDRVLIYKNNKVVVLYRPETNKIINFATGITVEEGRSTPTKQVSGVTNVPSPTEITTPTSYPTVSASRTPTLEVAPTSVNQ